MLGEQKNQQTSRQEAISSPEQSSGQPYHQWPCEVEPHLVITLLSQRAAMGAGTENNHAQVTGAVTKARCAEGT